MTRVHSYEFEGLESEVGRIWDRNAEFWDSRMGDGNRWHRELIAPNQERLLGLREDETVLDVACGNGNFARRMAELGADVLAFDVSEKMIEMARIRVSRGPGRIEYRVIDASEGEAVRCLGQRRFDAAVCTMAMMDMPTISPMLCALGHVLKPGGRFVFSVMHPCFNSTATRFVLEESDRGEAVKQEYSLRDQRVHRAAAEHGARNIRPTGASLLLPPADQRPVRRMLRRRVHAGRHRRAHLPKPGDRR